MISESELKAYAVDIPNDIQRLSQMKTLKFNNPEMRLYMCSMGKLFRVTAVCRNADEANRIMEKDRDQTCIAEDCNGLVYLAEQYGNLAPSAVLDDWERK